MDRIRCKWCPGSYNEALKGLRLRKVSEMLETAGVAANVESISGNIYVGVCVDGGCNT